MNELHVGKLSDSLIKVSTPSIRWDLIKKIPCGSWYVFTSLFTSVFTNEQKTVGGE